MEIINIVCKVINLLFILWGYYMIYKIDKEKGYLNSEVLDCYSLVVTGIYALTFIKFPLGIVITGISATELIACVVYVNKVQRYIDTQGTLDNTYGELVDEVINSKEKMIGIITEPLKKIGSFIMSYPLPFVCGLIVLTFGGVVANILMESLRRFLMSILYCAFVFLVLFVGIYMHKVKGWTWKDV